MTGALFRGPLAYYKVLIHQLEKYVRVLFLVTEKCIPLSVVLLLFLPFLTLAMLFSMALL